MDHASTLRKAVQDRRAAFTGGDLAFERSLGFAEGALRGLLAKDRRYTPRVDKAAEIAAALGLELYIGPPRSDRPRRQISAEARLMAARLAGCSVTGWGRLDRRAEHTTAPAPGDIDDPDAFWAIAVGSSMIPEGIRPGDYCLVSPGAQPALGARVWLEGIDGTCGIKRLIGMHAEGVTLLGWLPPEGGKQQSFTEDRMRRNIRAMGTVLDVHAGRPRPGAPAQWRPDMRAPELLGSEAPDWLCNVLGLAAGTQVGDCIALITQLRAAAPDPLPPLDDPAIAPLHPERISR